MNPTTTPRPATWKGVRVHLEYPYTPDNRGNVVVSWLNDARQIHYQSVPARDVKVQR